MISSFIQGILSSFNKTCPTPSFLYTPTPGMVLMTDIPKCSFATSRASSRRRTFGLHKFEATRVCKRGREGSCPTFQEKPHS